MADEEVRALLREMLATQREYLELVRRNAERLGREANASEESIEEHRELNRKIESNYSAQTKAYEKALAQYNENAQSSTWTNKVATILRSVSLLVIGLVLFYLVVFGLHKH